MYKKIFLLILLSSIISTYTAQAQVGEQQHRIIIGLNVGGTMNQIGFDPTIAQKWLFKPKVGVSFQIMSERYFNAYCSLLAELNYSTLGWKEDIRDNDDEPMPDTYERELNYLRIPFLAKIGWGKPKRGCMGYLLAGPEIGFLVSDKEKRSETWTMIDGHPKRPNGMYAQYGMKIDRKFDYGITGGAGMECNFGHNNISLDVRYYYGLSDLFSNGKRDIFSRSNNGAIILTLGYNFILKH